MIRRIVVILIVCIGLFYIGSGVFFYKKSLRRKLTVEIIKPDTTYNPDDLIVLKENFFDFENGWLNTNEIGNQKSYSGKTSLIINPQTEFAGEVSQLFSGIPTMKQLREVEISLKVWNDEYVGEGTIWVCEVDAENGKALSWMAMDLTPTLHKWETNTFRFKINPNYIKEFNRIKTYAWNKSKSSCFVDDVSIRYLGLPSSNKTEVFSPMKQSSFLYDLEDTKALERTETISEKIAHSGKYSSLMSGKNSRSVFIYKNANEVTNDTMTNITASAWFYPLIDNAHCRISFEIRNPEDEPEYWAGKSTEKMGLVANKWQKINAVFNLDPDVYRRIHPDDMLYVYAENVSRTKVYVDDFFISFGDNKNTRGIQTNVDMNSIGSETYQYSDFHPPFVECAMNLKHINNLNNTSLTKDLTLRPNASFSTGNFTGKSDGKDELLVIDENVISIIYFCESKSCFLNTEAMKFDTTLYRNAKFLTGDFTGDGKQDLLVITRNKLSLFDFSLPGFSTCMDNAKQTMNNLWSDETDNSQLKYFAGNFTGGKKCELFIAGNNGMCFVKKFNMKDWETMATGNIPHLVFADRSTQVCGKFFASSSASLITAFEDKNKMSYAAIKTINDKIVMVEVSKKDAPDDLFHWSELLFCIHSGEKKNDNIFSIGRSWRHEMKYITSGKDNFKISCMPQFMGFDSDQNPKYYEISRLIPGRFTGKNSLEVLCILYNCADKDFDGDFCKTFDSIPDLPNAVQLYSFPR